MESVISIISGEILSRFISFLINKHTDRACVEDKLERLQALPLRIHTVVEEGEGRHITNSRMLLQLRILVDALYKGYYVLDTFRFTTLEEISNEKQVTTSSALSTPLKRTHSLFASIRTTSANNDLQAAVDKLETAVKNMTESVILLGGSKQMHKRPYDTYIYIDKFMFSRIVEKQELIKALLQENSSIGAPDVIPVIGSYGVGKKSLVGYACNDSMVRSHFSSVLHLKSNNFWKVRHDETLMLVKTIVVVEFVSNVDDSEWVKFYTATSRIVSGSKIIIISRFQDIARFGTVKPIVIRSFSQEEFGYLFKALAFGSTDPQNHPRMASIAMELAISIDGLLLVANVFADLLRKNQNVQLWLHMLKRYRKSLERNFTMFGEYPRQLLEMDCPTDITMLIPPTFDPHHLMPSYEDSSSCKEELPKVKFGDLVAGSVTIVPEECQMIVWESRIPLFTKFVASCVKQKQSCMLPRYKKCKWSCTE